MTTIRRRIISNATRALAPIERRRIVIRSFTPTRGRWVPRDPDDLPPPWTPDRLVTVTVARVRWAERPLPQGRERA